MSWNNRQSSSTRNTDQRQKEEYQKPSFDLWDPQSPLGSNLENWADEVDFDLGLKHRSDPDSEPPPPNKSAKSHSQNYQSHDPLSKNMNEETYKNSAPRKQGRRRNHGRQSSITGGHSNQDKTQQQQEKRSFPRNSEDDLNIVISIGNNSRTVTAQQSPGRSSERIPNTETAPRKHQRNHQSHKNNNTTKLKQRNSFGVLIDVPEETSRIDQNKPKSSEPKGKNESRIFKNAIKAATNQVVK